MGLFSLVESKCRMQIVTIFLVEVQAVSKQYDVQAEKLTRQIQLLPNRYLPSLASIATSATPLTVRTAQLYYLTGKLASSEIEQFIAQLLVDTVIQKATLSSSAGELAAHSQQTSSSHTIDVFFHPGVTDTLAESVLAGAAMLDIGGLEQAQTGRRYLLDARLGEKEVQAIAESLLYNPVIQRYTFCSTQAAHNQPFQTLPVQHPSAEALQDGVGAQF